MRYETLGSGPTPGLKEHLVSTSAINVLVLNADYHPLKILPWQQAVLLVLEEKADLVTDYVGRLVRSAHESMPWPAVVRLRKFVKTRSRTRFNRQNLLARDGYECGYCGAKPVTKAGRPDLHELTLDHVIPRAQSKGGFVTVKTGPNKGQQIALTSWSNVIACCVSCNMSKADRTPEQAGMTLRKQPRVPTSLDILRMSLTKVRVPLEWAEYLPEGHEWRGYWSDELEPD